MDKVLSIVNKSTLKNLQRCVYQAELHWGTLFEAKAVALMMKSLTLNLMPSFSF